MLVSIYVDVCCRALFRPKRTAAVDKCSYSALGRVLQWFALCLGTHNETHCLSALCSVTCVPCLLLLFLPNFQTAGNQAEEKSLQGAVVLFLQHNLYICRAHTSVKTPFANSRVLEWLASQIHRVKVALTSPRTPRAHVTPSHIWVTDHQ